MADVEIDYSAVSSASYAVSAAGTNVSTLLGYIEGESTGIENPAQRSSLRMEVYSRLSQLRLAAANRAEAASDISLSLDAIHQGYSALDLGLATGDDG